VRAIVSIVGYKERDTEYSMRFKPSSAEAYPLGFVDSPTFQLWHEEGPDIVSA